MEAVGVGIGVVSLTFQVFSGCIKGYQLLTEAKNMPTEYQYLRVKLRTEQCRLLDWAHVANLNEHDEGLQVSNASRHLLLDVLHQQERLLLNFGKYDNKYKPLEIPLVVDQLFEEQRPAPPPPGTTENSHKAQLLLDRAESSLEDRFPQGEELLKRSLNWIKTARKYPARVKWASWDKAKVEELIQQLSALNEYMRDLLNSSQLQSLNIKQTRTDFQIMQLHNKFDHLAQLFVASMMTQPARNKQPLDAALAVLQLRGLVSTDEILPNDSELTLAALAQTKALHSAIEHDKLDDDLVRRFHLRPEDFKHIEIARSHIRLLDKEEGDDSMAEGQRIEARYSLPGSKPRQVWIEWKSFEPLGCHGGPDPKIAERIRRLAKLLKENHRTETFRAPHCLGFFLDKGPDGDNDDDPCRFGLVFEKPANVPQSTRPISLLDLIHNTTLPCPSLTDRIALMTRITETIERLHAVNWLHKGLRSGNVLFFAEQHSSPLQPPSPTHRPNLPLIPDIDFSRPYISGFDYSRPAQNDDMTEKPPENACFDVYRHPNVQGQRNRDPPSLSASAATLNPSASGIAAAGFKKSYDIYSLGIILLEIAYWQPIEHILDIPLANNPSQKALLTVKPRLLGDVVEGQDGKGMRGNYLAEVRSRLGNTVEKVVRACLQGPVAFGLGEQEDGRNQAVSARLQKGFYEVVVGELQGVKV